ncbi:hypothetical protein LQ327_29465 [Actinomycetospora endophytica]|uniref:Uncharacterized protein n=1 Tax=Actinomycetospora endophytica TaxID=2291215 RepID=A0ABS8PGV7_9PSEU|nr:hypothetical protein [Actinomycetospora endophytica]MCD2197507.1 hypothetical protein [Actinomycetospora endophytica]
MSLPTDPFAAPSSGPLALDLARAQDQETAAAPRRRRFVLAGVTGTLAVGAAAVGLSLSGGGEPEVTSAAASLAPAAGAAATLAPPAVGAPIVPASPAPPVVTTTPSPAAETAAPTTRSRPTTKAPSDRDARMQAYAAAMRARAAQMRAWEQAYAQAWERAMIAHAQAGGGHGHGHGHHR